MPVSIEWKITALDYAPSMDGLAKVATCAHFDVLASDADHPGITGRVYDTCPLDPPEPGTFEDFDALTHDKVLGWVKAKADVAAMEELAAAELDRQINPPVVSGVPIGWGA